ncbi:hypothetical protein Ciccas_002393 [Cichlidogyrus casuarinus]|uniref:Uncharacterized protein n=1 Tax=Cichlidogyrus casuarinus TaxID=1844966 RepID=A0ABD2QHC8_9PLAT
MYYLHKHYQNEEQTYDSSIRMSLRSMTDKDLLMGLNKKGPRSKSTGPRTLQKDDPFVRSIHKESHDTPVAVANQRWSIFIRQYESMSKNELLKSYRLLMNDHLRLERFLAIMSRDHEIARNRLESDLLDSMMCIEDLKQALEIRLARRRKIDPKEAEERRYLIKQNKKLLAQIETLEMTKLEMKEQLELLDFQLIEMEHQKNSAEEEVKKVKNKESTKNAHKFDNSDPLQSSYLLSQAEIQTLRLELRTLKGQLTAEMAKLVQTESVMQDLQRENRDLREQLVKIDDPENSLAESDKHFNRKIETSQFLDDQVLLQAVRTFQAQLNERDQEIRSLKENSSEQVFSLTLAELEELCAELDQKIDHSLPAAPQILSAIRLFKNAIQAKISSKLEDETLENDSTSNAISDRFEELHRRIYELIRENANLRATAPKSILQSPIVECSGTRGPAYFLEQLGQLQKSSVCELHEAQLARAEKRRVELEQRLSELQVEICTMRNEASTSEASLQASRRTELALRRRLLTAMESKESSTSQTCSNRCQSMLVQESKRDQILDKVNSPEADLAEELKGKELELVELRNRIASMEASNAALQELNQSDQIRQLEQTKHIATLEAEQMTLFDRLNAMQTAESSTQRGLIRLQALYEEMLREFQECQSSGGSSQDVALTSGSGQTEELVCLQKRVQQLERQNQKLKGTARCNSVVCQEVKKALNGFQERFVNTADQLTDAQMKCADLQAMVNTLNKRNCYHEPGSGAEVLRQLNELLLFEAKGNERLVEAQAMCQRVEQWIQHRLAIAQSSEAKLRAKIVQMSLESETSGDKLTLADI